MEELPLVQTVQYPANTINVDKSQNNGNWQMLVSMLDQSGTPNMTLEDNIILVHGDLSTKERIDVLRRMCTIERSAKNCLNFVVFVPGLFHLKMATTDAFWCVHVQPVAGRDDGTGFFKYIHHLCPRETGKFTSSPGFRRLHDSIHHATWADMLDCWRLEVEASGNGTLDAFAQSAPKWETIHELLEGIVKKYLPGSDFEDLREQDLEVQNLCFENHALRKQYGLLYLELSHTMNHGDVGRILHVFPYWIVFFKSTGKSKYAAHMIKFVTDLDHVYPLRLR